MKQRLAIALAAATFAAAVGGALTASADQRGSLNDGVYDGSQSPWAFPNCIQWSPKLKYWVWVCGPPYPKGLPHT